jgi:adenosylcobinamide kinase/adenosylcobinamide-phosphate guanylyltransferase|tara:strand:- start:271 stop:807 length:537 start_codon:yes stop_codon:yes gene_type:complete
LIHLVTGGARSGKSCYAEQLANEQAQVTYVATATPGDDEMAARIQRHKKDRPAHWALVEEPFELSSVVNASSSTLLIDCLTLYLTNWLCNEQRWPDFEQEKSELLSALKKASEVPGQDIFIVTNEVGSGIVPLGELSRRFADEAGWLNQAVAAIADDVTLVVSGCPLALKRNGVLLHG